MIGDDNAGPNPAAFFTERLRQQRHASDETVRAYRDTWKLLVGFAAARTGKQPSSLDIDDFDSDLIWEAVLSRGQGEAAATTVVVAAASLTG